jgi:ankyrin repeat protein
MPLHCAAYWGRADCAQLLITAGANLNAVNCAGMNPWEVAMESQMSNGVRPTDNK